MGPLSPEMQWVCIVAVFVWGVAGIVRWLRQRGGE